MVQTDVKGSGARTDFGFAVVDVDSHFYEPEVIWDSFVAPGYQSMARSALWHGGDARGNRLTVLNGSVAKELSSSKIVRHAIWRPGMGPDEIGALDADAVHEINPGASDPAARLADMDVLGIDQAIVYPTLFGEYHPLIENPLAAEVLAVAYNDWAATIAEASGGRVHPVAVLPMQSLLLAQRELDRVAEMGFKAVLLRPMLYRGDATAAADPQVAAANGGLGVGAPRGVFVESRHFRPLWRQVEQLGLVACVHPSVGSTNPDGTSLGTYIERVSASLNIGHSVAESVAYLQDNGLFLILACFQGLFEDFPALKVALAHGGASMLPLALEKAETYLWIAFSPNLGLSTGEPVSLEPEEILEERHFVASFDSWETTIARMPDLFTHNAAWGSRYPHHDAAGPAEAIEMLKQHAVDQPTIENLMGRNATNVFNLTIGARV